jgi:hypothetical protein
MECWVLQSETLSRLPSSSNPHIDVVSKYSQADLLPQEYFRYSLSTLLSTLAPAAEGRLRGPLSAVLPWHFIAAPVTI